MDTPLLESYGPTQRQALECLLREPAGLSVEQLTTALQVTPSAVRQLLAGLERDGLVERGGQQATGGRPERLFRLAAAGREAFPRRYRQLAETLIAEVADEMGPRSLESMMRRMGRRAAEATGGRLSIPAAAEALKQAGYEAGVNPANKSEIVAHNCVFHQLADKHAAVCQFDIAFLEAATGSKVEHRECMVRGGRVCRFGLKK